MAINTNARFYYNNGSDKPLGPVSLDELRMMAARAEIAPQTPVIREGAVEWGRYRDLQSGERTREVAGAVADRAMRVAAALQTEESRSFSLGLLIGIVRAVLLPWEIICSAARMVSDWGANQFVSPGQDSVASATLGRIVAPLVILFWTIWWCGDAVAMVVLGRASVTLTLASLFSSVFTLGFGGDFGRIASASAYAGFLEAITVHDFGARLAWGLKIALVGYVLTPIPAVIGELFSGLAALISLGRTARQKDVQGVHQ